MKYIKEYNEFEPHTNIIMDNKERLEEICSFLKETIIRKLGEGSYE